MVDRYDPDMGGWSVLAILKEVGRLARKNVRLLQPFVLAFLLPAVLIFLLHTVGTVWFISQLVPHRMGGVVADHHYHYHHHHPHHYHLHHFGFNAWAASSKVQQASGESDHDYKQPQPSTIFLIMYLVNLVIVLVSYLLLALALAAIAKAVHYIYSGDNRNDPRDPSIVRTIFKSLPAALLRVFITDLWILLIGLVTALVLYLPIYLLRANISPSISPLVLESVYRGVLYVVLLVLIFIFLVSEQVAVLEPENYGRAALMRSWKLVQVKWLTALALFAIFTVWYFLVAELQLTPVVFSINGKLPYWTVYILAVVSAILYLAFSVSWLLTATVLYFSCKLKESGADVQLRLPEENPYRPIPVVGQSVDRSSRAGGLPIEMVEGYDPDMGGWGVIAILKEVGRLARKYVWLLHPFVLEFFLPVALIQLLQMVGLIWLTSHVVPHRLVADHHYHYHHHYHPHHYHHHHLAFNAWSASSKASGRADHDVYQPQPSTIALIIVYLVILVIFLVSYLLSALALAAIAKAVHYIYSGDNRHDHRDPSIVRTIFKSLPAALLRVFITSLWILLIGLVTALVIYLPCYLLKESKISPLFLISVRRGVLYVAVLVVIFLFSLSPLVAVLEPENYGRAALKRSWKLVQAKLPTALALFAIYAAWIFLHIKLNRTSIQFPTTSSTGKLPYWTTYILAVVSALLTLASSAFWLLVRTVLYFSCKLKSAEEEQLRLPEANPYRPIPVVVKN